MNHFVRCSALAVYVLSTSVTFAVAPQRTFVHSMGNDANPCSLTAPCRGFQAAINAVAADGEVVALDSAGYGAMQIHKSVSVIVPPGVHAGLSPVTGIPLPGFPGQSTVVLIDIQSTDTVVLRGLNVNHQGSLTGGIDWLSANGGIVHIENTTVNGFPNEGLFMRAPNGKLFVKDSIFRNNGHGIYIRGGLAFSTVHADRVRIENSTVSGITNEDSVFAVIRDSVISANDTGIHRFNSAGTGGSLTLDRCAISRNVTAFKLYGVDDISYVFVAASTIHHNPIPVDKTGPFAKMYSLGNNSSDLTGLFDFTLPLQ